jgi:hypothetical protein
VSPTTASKAFASLEGRGLARHDQEWVAAGPARTTRLYRAYGVFDRTPVQFLKAGLERPEHRLEPTVPVAGLRSAGLGDLLAMTLNAIAGRAQLRDYFDLMAIEQTGGRTVEEGIGLFLARYRPEHPDSAIRPILLGLGYLDDVMDDPFLPVARESIERYWQARQRVVVANLDRQGIAG